MTYKCNECGSNFSTPSTLRKHVNKFHPQKLLDLAPFRYKKTIPSSTCCCEICKKTFNHRQSLRRHLRTHNVQNTTQTKTSQANHDGSNLKTGRNSRKCPLCEYYGLHKKDLQQHFKNVHQIPLVSKNLTFVSMDDFNQWKMKIENETNSKFVKRNTESFKSHVTTYFVCHRSGNYVPEGKGERHIKTQGTNKINAFCPANIQMQLGNENEVSVQYLESHVGHVTDIGHLQLTASERQNLAMKIAAKIPFDDILDEVRESITDSTLNRIHLVSKKDLFNIESSFNLCSSSVRHSNDAISVESWVIEMQRVGDCIVFYKPQGTILKEQPQLKEEDFVLIIMTPAQCEVLKRFGSDCICVDGTHGLNNYNFELHTLLIIDDIREGFPFAFLLSNRSDTYVFTLFFNEIKNKAGLISPQIFMSDLAESYFNAWLQVMGNPLKRLFCTWHIDRAWRKNLPKINNKEKQVMVYKQLRTLLEERDPVAFEGMIDQFCNNLSDPDTTDFIVYFKNNYQINCRNWAYCYRLHSGLNTNMHLERMHRTIKYVYLGGKKVKRLDKGIAALMRFIRNKLIDRLIVINKGKISSKLKNIRDRHKHLKKMNPSSIVTTEHGWEIPSLSSNEIYLIQEVRESCTCQLTCSECNICLHKYYCSCLDSSIKFNMCKHIHLLAQYRQEQEKENYNSGTAITVTDDTMEDEDNLHIHCGQKNDESEVILSQLSKKPKTSSSVQDRQCKILAKFQKILYGDMSTEKLDIIEKMVDSLPPTLAATDHVKEIVLPSSKQIVHNEKIIAQRRLWSTKKKLKKTNPIKKPTPAEAEKIAINILLTNNNKSNE